ncbi:probable E3 ubiquitin-protein ligase MARCHF10 [Centropristis striata]|uniref:probable E3 ubiquitin-protein ligase MARCHF10 n=1 Tax=Centropristis striata TaxID=184440 RepID=UPI0027E17DFC|nr:probable E3 ubiquitin-protein ligase MARCHF10 [Centropristis striata]
MFWWHRQQRDLDHQNQDQMWDRERADTEVKQEMPALSKPLKSMSPRKRASKPSPRSSGKSASSESGSPWKKSSVSCLKALSSETQSRTAELAATSKTPHSGKAPLASRCNKVRHVKFCSRSEHEKDGGLKGSTHREASEQRQSRGILKSCSKMKHLFGKTNTEKITDSERLSGAETLDGFLGGNATLLHVPTLDKLPSESESESSSSSEDDEDGDLTYTGTYFPLTFSQPSSAAGAFGYSRHSPESFNSLLRTSTNSPGYSLSPLPEQTGRPRVPLIPDRLDRRLVDPTKQIYPLPKRHKSRQTSPKGGFCPRQSTEEYLSCTPYTLWSSKEPWRQSASGQPDSLNVDGVFGDIKQLRHVHESPAAEGGAAAAAQSAQCHQDSSRLIVCRPKPRFIEEEEEDQCRICHSSDNSISNQLISPCLCSGTVKFVHLDCLRTWIRTKIHSGSLPQKIKRCELCHGMLLLDPSQLDLDKYYREQRRKVERIPEGRRVRDLGRGEEVLNFRTLILRGLDPRMLPQPCPVPRVRVWPSFPLLIRRRLRSIHEGRNPSTEASSDSD